MTPKLSGLRAKKKIENLLGNLSIFKGNIAAKKSENVEKYDNFKNKNKKKRFYNQYLEGLASDAV